MFPQRAMNRTWNAKGYGISAMKYETSGLIHVERKGLWSLRTGALGPQRAMKSVDLSELVAHLGRKGLLFC